MTTDTGERLYHLPPAVYRVRDPEQGGPLRTLLAIVEDELDTVEGDIDNLYDNWFVETCDEWVVPYIGDLLGVRGLNALTATAFSQRAYVANTLAYRRRKGTAAVLEQLARDVTGWPALAVEFFQRLATTQYLNHPRPENLRTPDIRSQERLDLVGGPFEEAAHTAEVRRISTGRGRYNIPHVGLFLWRLQAYPVTRAPAFAHGDGRYSFSQLGNDLSLFTHPVAETDLLQRAGEVNVPGPIRRRALHRAPAQYYGLDRSIAVRVDGVDVPREKVVACDLSAWQHRPPANPDGMVAVDPTTGRLALPAGETAASVEVDYYYGFSGEVGGGFYDRPLELPENLHLYVVAKGTDVDTVQKALNAWQDDGRPDAIVEIADSREYAEALSVQLPPGRTLTLRAANRQRPLLSLTGELMVGTLPPAPETPPGLHLDGLLIAGNPVVIADGDLGSLVIRQCTLVPGLALAPDSAPLAPARPSLTVAAGNRRLEVTLERTISGGLRLEGTDRLTVKESIVDGLAVDAIRAGRTVIDASTVFGAVAVEVMEEASNSVFTGPVVARRTQAGCVRFCYLPADSRAPRRHRCQPDLAVEGALDLARKAQPPPAAAEESGIGAAVRGRVRPAFTDRRYGLPGYAQLRLSVPVEIRAGADDEGEMGVFHHLQGAQREANLHIALDEYLRFGLEAGLIFVT